MTQNTNLKDDYRYVQVVPHKRQLMHQQLEMYAFFHFSINTFTNNEWGDGHEDPQLFNPVSFDAKQWIKSIKAAKMTGAILTCKHHDGFCLWPSKYTKHSVASSPYKDGKGDIVREVADACHAAGIKFGIYLSPWDMNNPAYGTGKGYDDYYVAQLEELLTNYGDIFAIWLDGACGEGENGKTQVYDWDRYYEVMRRLQPDANICVCGNDVRWCGNESGVVRPSEWSVVPAKLADCERIKENSQQTDDAEFRSRGIKSDEQDLGSRARLCGEDKLIWYPAEVNTSIRPGWFYHSEEDNEVKPADELFDLYCGSVGGNATLLLNIPPTPEGLLHKNDIAVLFELGAKLEKAFGTNLAANAQVSIPTTGVDCGIENILTDDYDNFFMMPQGQTSAEIELKLIKVCKVSFVVLKENINLSQRIEAFEIYARQNGEYKKIYEGTIVGYKKIVRLAPVETDSLLIKITDSRVCPTLSFVGVY